MKRKIEAVESTSNTEAARIQLPPGVPEFAGEILINVGYFEPDSLRVGSSVPLIELRTLDATTSIRIGGATAKPMLLIFGSYT